MPVLIQVSSSLLLACAIALAAGCDNKPPRPKTEASSGASSQGAERAAVPAKDAALAEQVKSALAQAGPAAQQLQVESNAGVVRIRGRVDSDDTKQRIQEAAKKIPGVTWVQDQVSVAPEAPAPSAAPKGN